MSVPEGAHPLIGVMHELLELDVAQGKWDRPDQFILCFTPLPGGDGLPLIAPPMPMSDFAPGEMPIALSFMAIMIAIGEYDPPPIPEGSSLWGIIISCETIAEEDVPETKLWTLVTADGMWSYFHLRGGSRMHEDLQSAEGELPDALRGLFTAITERL